LAESKQVTVTFDTNTLSDVVSPETSQRADGQENGTRVREAIQSGHVRGFFCETLVTLEGIRNSDRVDVIGSTRIESEFSSLGKNMINITLAVKQDRKPLPAKFRERIQTAQELGIRALRGPARIGWVRVKEEDDELLKPYESVAKLAERLDKVNELATVIAARGLGHAVPVKLGLQFTARDGVTQPELWFQGLRRAKESERKQIQRAIAEWADGDSVASHYGHGIGLFCTEDFGRNAGGPSILDDNNRAWLSENYGIKFVTLAGLAAMFP
jgi:hypothetical protein